MDRKKFFELSLMPLIFLLTLLFLYLVRILGFATSPLHVSFTIGFLLTLGFSGGRIASSFGLPQLSGFLAVGVLCGPFGLSLLGNEEIKALSLFNDLALALIAIQAGAEISIKFLRSGTKSILSVIICQSMVLIVGMSLIFMALVFWGGFKVHDSALTSMAVALIFAVLSISKAPADTLAILGETKLKGEFANHVLGVVVLIDILVIVLFQIVLLSTKPYIIPGAFFDSGKIFTLFEEQLSSLAAGVSVGLIYIVWFYFIRLSMRHNVMFLILSAFGIGSMCEYLRYDTLMVFIVGGFIVSNLSQRGHDLVDTVETLSLGVMIVFFATAGALLDLEALKTLWPYALILAFSRMILSALGTLLGHLWAKDDMHRFRYSFAGYISQAGVTLVLAQGAARSLGDIGQSIAALAVAVVAINELIGPIAFKTAIRRELSRMSRSASSDG